MSQNSIFENFKRKEKKSSYLFISYRKGKCKNHCDVTHDTRCVVNMIPFGTYQFILHKITNKIKNIKENNFFF